MEPNNLSSTTRRGFIGKVATGAATIGFASIATPLRSYAEKISTPITNPDDPDEWFNKIKGKHRIVFDATRPHEIMPFAWPKIFLMTNEKTGTPLKENSVVVVLRHDAIPYAFDHNMWAKYKFGELFKADDPLTKKPAERNPFWKPKEGDFNVPGLGNVAIGINQLQQDGVMFCVCDMAMNVYSAVAAQQTSQDAAAVKKEWITALLPGIQVVPSGVWAVGRAQEHGCAYCFAG
ncbi:MAG TPA: twin-arginine translocation signal domain-containing protein [Chitinophagaceae bacterium]